MSTKGGKARFAPGGREYEKRKAQNKRRGPRRTGEVEKSAEEKKRKDDGEEDSEEGENEESGSEEGSEEEETNQKTVEKDEDSEEGEEGEEEGTWKKKSARQAKPKGLQGVIDVANPNREKKEHIKANEVVNLKQVQPLSRREKEALEKQKQQNRVEKSDMARLAQIRRDREAAAKKREEEKTSKDTKLKEGIKKLTVQE